MIEGFIEKAAKEVAEIVIAKNKDYGNSFEELVRKYGHIALLIRFHDKLNRLENLLLKKEQHVMDESIEDTVKDICGYALLSLALLKKEEEMEKNL